MRTPRAAALALLIAVPALPGCGDDDDGKRDRFAEIPKRTIEAPADQTAPRWQQVAAFEGQRATSEPIQISPKAIQWRVRWRCQTGRFAVTVSPPPRTGRGRAEGGCPGSESKVWASTGRHRLRIEASGAWRLVVEEELRTPLREPPLAAMASGRVLASGAFYPIEIKGAGTASLYRLPSGRLALRVQRFRTEPNPSLVVWASQARRPKTTKQAFNAPHTELRTLKSTIGDQNYLIPKRLTPQQIRSIVIWNKPSRIAYAAAALGD